MPVQVNIQAENNPNKDAFSLASGLLVGVPAQTLTALIQQYGGAPVYIKILIASPTAVGDYVMGVKANTAGGYSAQLDGFGEAFANAAVQTAVGLAIKSAAIALGATAGVPLTIAVGIGTVAWIGMNSDLVNPFVDAVKYIGQSWYKGTLYGEFVQALDTAVQATNTVIGNTAQTILEFLDGLTGTPENPVPISDLITDFASYFASLKNSPIVVDLQNNGLSLISRANAANNVFFDMEGKGFAKDVGWIAPSEAFLVRDGNGNGVIDNVTEMFGDNAGTSAFAKLKALDTNNNNYLLSSLFA
jgi:hypothetical protein